MQAEHDELAARLADYAAALKYEDLDPQTIEAVKRQFSDALGCGLSAVHQEPVRIVRRLALASGKGDAVLFGTRSRTSAEQAAFVNGVAVRFFDYNDIYSAREITHPSDAIPACLAVAQTRGATGRDLILAIAIVYEIVCRLADAAGISQRGWDHPCYTLPAVALAAGKLMKLTPAQLTQAVNIALAGHLSINQTRVQALSNWKGMADGNAARNAVFAATLAAEGLTGPSPIFEGKAGFFKYVSEPFAMDIAQFGGGKGKDARFKINDITVKMYPALGMAQTAVPAALDAARQAGGVQRIVSVQVHTTEVGKFTSGSDPQKWAPKNSETADHSLPYIVAKAMFDGDIDHDSYNEASLRDPLLLAFLQKVVVIVDPELTAMYPKYYPTRVTVTRDDGKVFSKQTNDTPGFPTSPMQRSDYEVKFRKNAKGILQEERVASLLAAIWALETCADLGELTDAMAVMD